MDIYLDVDDDPLELTDSELLRMEGLRKRTLKGNFIPAIPLSWFKIANQLPGKALSVAIVIRLRSALTKSNIIPLSNRSLSHFGLNDRKVKKRALVALEQAGLIK